MKTKIHSQLIYSLVFKVISMFLVFLTTSITFKYLGKSDYGIWTTIYSIISWVYLLDFGFSNVIKTELPAIVKEKTKEINTLVTTIYVGIGIISLFILFVYIILNTFMSLGDFLNIDTNRVNFNYILSINLLFSVSILLIGNYKALFVGILKTHLVELSLMTIQLFIFISIFILNKYDLFSGYPKVLIISFVFGIVNVLVSIFFTIHFFNNNQTIKISIKYFDLKLLKTKVSLALKYFIIQICMIIIFSTDYMLIAKYFGSKQVANYDIILKIYQVPMLLAIVGLSPFWSIFAKRFAEKQYKWIKRTLIIYNFSFLIFILGIIILYFIIDQIIFLWIKTQFEIPKKLLLSISLYIVFRSFTAMYNYFLNGINKINLSLYLTIFGAVINIPVCIILIKTNLGVSGIVVGTCLSILPLTIILPIQAFNIINKKIKFLKDD